MREHRRRNAETLLNLPDWKARLARRDEGMVDFGPGDVPRRFELLRCLFDIYGNRMLVSGSLVMRCFQD